MKSHFSWKEENREPRNGREWKLYKAGKPTPAWTKEHNPRCRACKGNNFIPYVHYGTPGKKCADCLKRNVKAHYERHKNEYKSRASRSHAKLKLEEVPPAKDGPTLIRTTWFLRNLAHVYGRVYGGEVFLLESHGAPIGYFVPVEKFK